MSSVDNRVVNMGFNGAQFFTGVLQAIDLLSRLDQSIQMVNATKGMDKLSNAANNLDMTGVEGQVSTIADRFSTLGIIGMSVLNRLTGAALNFGNNVVHALAIDPILGGYNEFELKMKSIQTILANTQSRYGTTNEQVTTALDELNEYADKTIYNFSQMTQNIGRFTAAGVDLNTSVTGIKGLANLGAFFGADATQVSRGMYQMSQALATGSVKLIDWNSLVNSNMAGSEFVDDITRVARRHGIAIDDMIEKEGSFRETLREGWLTNDIFLESLSHFADVADADVLRGQGYSEEEIEKIQYLGRTANDAATKVRSLSQMWETLNEEAGSGWAQTWELIAGDFNESTELFNGAYKRISPVISGMADARNELLKGWRDLGGRDKLIEGLTKLGDIGLGTITMLGESLSNAFNITPEGLYAFSAGFDEFMGKLQLSEETLNNVRNTFEGFFSIFSIAGKFIGFGVSAIGEVFQALFPLADGFFDITSALADGPKAFNDWLEQSDALGNALQKLHEFLEPIRGAMTDVSEGIGAGVDWIKSSLEELLPILTEGFPEAIKSFLNGGDGITEALKGLGDGIGQAFEGIKGKLKESWPGFTEASNDFFKHVTDSFLENISKPDATPMEKMSGFVEDVASETRSSLESANEEISFLIPLSDGIGETLGEVINIFGNIPWGDFFAAISVFGAALSFKEIGQTYIEARRSFSGVRQVLNDFDGLLQAATKATKGTGLMIKLHGFAEIASSLSFLLAAIIGLAVTEAMAPGSLGAALGTVTTVIIEFFALVELLGHTMNSVNVMNAKAMVNSMVPMAFAFVLVAAAVSELAKVDPEGLNRALGVMAVLMPLMSVLAELMSLTGSVFGNVGGTSFSLSNGSAGQVFKMAALLGILAIAMDSMSKTLERLSHINPESMTTAMGALIQMLGTLTLLASAVGVFTSNISAGKFSYSGGQTTFRFLLTIAVLVAGVKVLADTLADLTNLPQNAMQNALSVVSSLLIELGVVASAMGAASSHLGNVKARDVAMVAALCLGLKTIVDAVAQLAGIEDAGALARSLGAVSTLFGELFGAVAALGLVADQLENANLGRTIGLAILAIAVAKSLREVVGAVRDIADESGNVNYGAIAGVAGLLIALGGALAIMMHQMGNTGFWKFAGLSVFVRTLTTMVSQLSTIDPGGAAAGIGALAGALYVLAKASQVIGKAKYGLGTLAKDFLMFAAGAALVGVAANQITQAFTLLSELAGPALENLCEAIPKIGQSLVDTFFEMLSAFNRRMPSATADISGILTGIIQSVYNVSGELLHTIVQMIIDTCNSIVEYGPQIIDAIINALVTILGSLGSRLPDLMGAIKGFVDSLNKAFNDAFGQITIDPGTVEQLRTTMWSVIGAIGLLKFSEVKPRDALRAVFEIGSVLAAMTGLFVIIGSVADQDSVAALGKINESITVISLVCLAMAEMPTAGAIQAAKSLGIFIGSLTGIVAALGAIKQIPGADWLVQEGGVFLEHIGNAVGQFIGGIGAGVTGAFTANFAEIGTRLGTFATNAKPFFDVLSSYDETTVKNITAFNDMISAVGELGSDGLNGLKKVEGVSEYLPGLGVSLRAFSDNMQGVDPTIMTSASELINSLATLALNLKPAVIDEHGTMANMQQLTDFSSQLSDFAQDLKDAIDKFPPADQLDTTGLSEVIDIAGKILDIQDRLPPLDTGSGDVFQGNAQTLNAFATGISEWSDAMQTAITRFPSANITDTSGLDEMIEVTDALADIQVKIAEATKIGGWGTQQFMGIGNNWGTGFAGQIASLAGNLSGLDLSFKNFGQEGDYSPARVRNMIAMIDGLADIQVKLAGVKFNGDSATKIINIGGLAQTIAEHITDFSTLATNISGLQVDAATTEKFGNFATCLGSLADVQTKLADFSGDDDTISGKVMAIGTFVHSLVGDDSTFMTDVETLANSAANINPANISTFNAICTNMKTLVETLNGVTPINESLITQFSSNITSLCNMFKDPESGFGLIGGNNFTAISTNIQTLAGVIPQLISAFSGLSGMGDDGMGVGANITGFLQGIKDLFSVDFATGVTDMTAGIQTLSDSISAELSEITGIFDTKKGEFETAGRQLGSAFVNGINDFGAGGTPNIDAIVNSCLNAISSKVGQFKTKGEEAGQHYVDGVGSKEGDAYNKGVSLASQAAAGASGGYDQMYTQGQNAGQGYVDGIESKLDEAEAIAAKLAALATNSTANAQQSQSPSKKFRQLGQYAGEGYALGIEDTFGLVNRDAGEMVGHALSLAQQLSSTLGENGDPVIKPIYDGSEVDKGIAGTDAMLRALQNRALATSFGLAHGVSDTIAKSEAREPDTEREPVEANPTYNFTQNNYSPKAISRLEVYRDTKGLLARAKKEAVK